MSASEILSRFNRKPPAAPLLPTIQEQSPPTTDIPKKFFNTKTICIIAGCVLVCVVGAYLYYKYRTSLKQKQQASIDAENKAKSMIAKIEKSGTATKTAMAPTKAEVQPLPSDEEKSKEQTTKEVKVSISDNSSTKAAPPTTNRQKQNNDENFTLLKDLVI